MICYQESTKICKTHSKQGFSILISDCMSIWKHMFARLKINSFKSQQITIKWISLEISKNPKDFICNTAAVIYLEQTTSCSSFSRIAVLAPNVPKLKGISLFFCSFLFAISSRTGNSLCYHFSPLEQELSILLNLGEKIGMLLNKKGM